MKATSRIFFLATILLSSIGSGFAQNLIFFQKTDSKSYLIRKGGGGDSQAVTDYFIRALSQGNGKPVERTEYVLVHDQFIRATKISSTEFQLYVTLQGIRLTGDTDYREFEMADLLKPSSVKFTLERLNAQGQTMSSWDFSSVPLNSDPAILANFKGIDSMSVFDDHTFRFRDLNFLYEPSAKVPFSNRTQMVDEYYSSVPEMEELYRELKAIDPEEIEQLNIYETDLRRLRSQIETIRGRNYEQALGLNSQHDPAGFLPRFRENDAYAAELATRIKDNKANLYRLYYKRGVTHLENGDRPNALKDLQQAINLEPKFAPSHLAMVNLRYQEGNIEAASQGLLNIFQNLDPDPKTREEGSILAGTFYQNYLGNADYALKQQRLEDGLSELDAASALCRNIAEVPCTAQLDELLGQAHGGVFDGLAANAQKSLNSGQPERAIEEALYARRYAVDHQPYVSDTGQVVLILNQAYLAQYQRLLGDVELLLQSKDVAGAEQMVAETRDFRLAHLAAIPDESALISLENRVAHARYLLMIEEGKSLAVQQQWSDALAKYESALDLERTFQFAQDPQLPELALATAKSLVLQQIRESLELARSNRVREARNIRLAVDEVRSRYSLQGDAVVEPPYQEMKDAIFNQECLNAQAEFDDLVRQAVSASELKDFLDANTHYESAMQVSVDNKACGMDVSPARDGKAKISPAVSYLRKLGEVNQALERALYREAVAGYLAGGQAFEAGGLGEKFGLEHVSLFDFIQQSGRNEFMRYGVDHFAGEQDYTSSIAMLTELLQRGYSKCRLKVPMVNIGQALAVRDFQADSTSDPKIKGLTYTNGNKRLKKLYKAYCKQWKQMD